MIHNWCQPIIPRMTFWRRTDDPALTYGLEGSDHLKLWQEGEFLVSLTAMNLSEEPFQEVTYEYRDSAGPGEREIFRMIATSLTDGDPGSDLFTFSCSSPVQL